MKDRDAAHLPPLFRLPDYCRVNWETCRVRRYITAQSGCELADHSA